MCGHDDPPHPADGLRGHRFGSAGLKVARGVRSPGEDAGQDGDAAEVPPGAERTAGVGLELGSQAARPP